MAPKLTVIYFDIPGLAEPVRWALELSGLEWTDKRFTREEFGPFKSSEFFCCVGIMGLQRSCVTPPVVAVATDLYVLCSPARRPTRRNMQCIRYAALLLLSHGPGNYLLGTYSRNPPHGSPNRETYDPALARCVCLCLGVLFILLY